MARRFIGTGQVRYIGVPYSRPVPICGGGTAVPLQFDWNAYGASSAKSTINVLVSIAPPDPNAKLLKRISSVYIDNTNSPTPIYVYAPDTQYVATAQPNSAGWYPMYTNDTNLWVIGIGFVDGQIPYTTIFVSDLFIPPYTDLEIAQTQQLLKASPTIQNAGNLFQQGNFAVPAVGDQGTTIFANLAAGTQEFNLFPVQATGFYYVSAISCCFGVAATGAINLNSGATLQNAAHTIAKWTFSYFMFTGAATGIPCVYPYSMSGMNVKLDATQGWVLTLPGIGGAALDGIMDFNVCYTYNPLTP